MKTLKNGLFCVKTLFRYAPFHMLLVVACHLIPSFFTGLQIIFTQHIVDTAVAFAKGTGEIRPVIVWGVLLVIMLTLWTTLHMIAGYEEAVVSVKLKKKMAPDIAKRMSRLEFSAFEEQGTQEIFQKMSDEPDKQVYFCGISMIDGIPVIVSFLFTMTVYFSISVWVGAGVVLLSIPMALINVYSAGRQVVVTEESADANRRMGDLKSLLTNKHAMFEMKLFQAEELLTKKWNFYSGKWEEITLRENRRVLIAGLGGRVLGIVYLIFIVCMSAVGFLRGSMTLGQFTATINSAGTMSYKIRDIMKKGREMLTNCMEMKFYRQFMKMKERTDDGDVEKLSNYDIVFENVSFRYPGTEREILRNVTFYVKEGERIAFVGENGAGKSTVIKLLCGLYEPDSGNVTIGGVPVRRIRKELRTSLLSVVFQDFQSYQLTLRENVAFGNLNAMSEDGRLMHALELADAGELVLGQEKGLDRNLGKLTEDGQDLSKGQWQRVAMARAFVSDAKYVVLDEPTAALDPLAESHMYENFARIFKEHGTIMISHRLASAKMADRIFVLDGGRIVQNGSHGELMEREGLYRTMYLAQSSFYQSEAQGETQGETAS